MSGDEGISESSFASFDKVKLKNKTKLNIKQILC